MKLKIGTTYFLCILLCMLVAACATNHQTFVADPLKVPAKSGESNVVISITANTAQVTGIDLLTVQRKTGPNPYDYASFSLIRRLPDVSRDTSVFIGALPPGVYRFEFLAQASKSVVLTEGGRGLLGEFEVRDGKPVDLGRLVLTNINSKVILGRSRKESSNVALLKAFGAEYADLFSGEVALGWLTGRHDNDHVEEYADLSPIGADHAMELGDGRIIAASRLGTVLIRSAEGRWTAARSRKLESILYATPIDLPDASMLAVGEFNTILRQTRGESRLEPIDAGDLPPGNLLFIGGSAEHGWYIAQQRAKEAIIYHSAALDHGKWQLIRKDSTELSLWSGKNSFWIWPTKSGLGYAVSGGGIHFLDYATGVWTNTVAPRNTRILGVSFDPDHTLSILTSPGGGFGGVFSSNYVSEDFGATWKAVESDFSVKVSTVHKTPAGTLLVSGGVFSDPELHASTDDGKTWKKQSKYWFNDQLVVMPSGLLLSMDSGRFGVFSIKSSKDEGATWTTEYSTFDKQAYDAQKTSK